jgi:prepilin-type N-terminal cleavage/methylation domain-containing protein/prepilin-type processing-associated H-X9-DG protein
MRYLPTLKPVKYRKDSTMKTDRAGFTLIELLVVIAIIAILAAILFPVFAKVREKARQTQCLSNEKQIGLAVLQYVEDYDESYPLAQLPNYSEDWTAEISPYVKAGNGGFSKTSAIWGCPSFPSEVGGLQEQNQYRAMDNIFADPSHAPGGGATMRPTNLSDLDHPSDQLMIFEGGLYGPDGFQNPYSPPGQHQQGIISVFTASWAGWSTTNQVTDLADASDCDNENPAWASIPPWAPVTGEMCGVFPRYRHTGVSNMLFCDGHAKAVHNGWLNWTNNIFIPGLTAGEQPYNTPF